MRPQPPAPGRTRRLVDAWRPGAITLGAPGLPLAVLFGLNAVDELDRAAFSVLLPDIRDHFGLSDAAALSLVGLTAIAIVLIELPLAFFADRRNRVRIAAGGAAVWALFSVATGLAVSVGMLAVARIGAGGGKAVVTPTHSSLLADFYEPAARVKVFSVHRLASSVGQITGPLLAGVLAARLGWRAPFLLFAIPTTILVLLALRLREPVRGRWDRAAAGADDTVASVEEAPEGPWSTMRILGRIPTVRRIWMAAPFLGVALFGVPSLLALIYEDVYDLGSAQRGAIAAGVEPLQIVGVLVAMPAVARAAEHRPGVLLRFVALVGVADAALLVVLAYAPHVAVAVGTHALLAASIGTLAPAFFSLVSLIAPPRVRSAAFTTMSLFAIPGVALVLPVMGATSDAVGLQASVLALVPVAVISGLILASAAPFVSEDIATVRADSILRAAVPHGTSNPVCLYP
jgi:branched-chain amino acid transport system ATP-binding protein